MRSIAVLVSLLFSTAGCAVSHERADLESPSGPELASSASLAIDETSLYWVDAARAAVLRAPRGGGPATVLASAAPSLYAPIAITSREVFWGDRGHGIQVRGVALSGGGPARIAGGRGGPIGVAADLVHLYFSRMGEGSEFALVEIDLATGTERMLAPQVAALGMVLDGQDVVGTSCGPNGVWRVSPDGAVHAIATGTFCPITLALHDGEVFFSDYEEPTNPAIGGAGIYRASAAGSAATRLTLSDGISFAVHRGLVYTALDGQMVQVARDGQAVEIGPALHVLGVAVDDAFVYWTEQGPHGSLELMTAPLP